MGAVKATWSNTTSDKCSFCRSLDTHSHRQLECPTFQSVRSRHPQAITYLQKSNCGSHSHGPIPDIQTLRQLMSYRGQNTEHTHIRLDGNILYFYTDGSADTPVCPDTRRAAWSAIQFYQQMPSPPTSRLRSNMFPAHSGLNR